MMFFGFYILESFAFRFCLYKFILSDWIQHKIWIIRRNLFVLIERKRNMATMLKQTHLCGNVLILFLFCTLIFNGSDGAKSDFGVTSVPPSCVWKCEGCTPCTPILVIVPPSAPEQTDSAFHGADEYYPLVWKCNCGGKLYNPYRWSWIWNL